MSFRPLGDRVAIELIEQADKTAGGIYIPETAKEKPSQGKVVAVGNGLKNEKGDSIAMEVKVGDTVMFGKWAGTEVTIDGKKLMIMKESDIMGVVA
jgi:chaperonin GroES